MPVDQATFTFTSRVASQLFAFHQLPIFRNSAIWNNTLEVGDESIGADFESTGLLTQEGQENMDDGGEDSEGTGLWTQEGQENMDDGDEDSEGTGLVTQEGQERMHDLDEVVSLGGTSMQTIEILSDFEDMSISSAIFDYVHLLDDDDWPSIIVDWCTVHE